MLAVTEHLKQQRPDTVNAKDGWQPLLTLIEKQTISYTQQQGLTEPSDKEVLRLLQSSNLSSRDGSALYAHLNKTLRDKAVRIVIGAEVRGEQGVSYLDFRCPADIWHPDTDNPDQMITCAQAVRNHGYKLCEQLSGKLPCIAVLMSSWPRRYKDEPRKWYRTYPLECCWYKPEDGGLYAGDDAWQPAGACQLAVPPWIADIIDAIDDKSLVTGISSSIPDSQSGPAPAASRTTAEIAALRLSVSSCSTPDAAAACSSSGAAGSPNSSDSTTTSYTQSHMGGASAGADGGSDEPLGPQHILRNSFNIITNSLLPTPEEKTKVKAAVKGVHEAVSSIAKKKPWKLGDAPPVGSFKRNTSLRGSHDLDLQLMLNANEFAKENDSSSFTSISQQCLSNLRDALCGKPAKGSDPEKLAKSGWREAKPAPSSDYLCLRHDKLGFDLDIKVFPSLHMALGSCQGTTSRQQALLKILITRRRIAMGLAAAESADDLPHSDLSFEMTCPDILTPDLQRLRNGFLTPLMTEAVQGIEERFSRKYGFKSAGMIATTVMRAMKALSMNGFVWWQQQQQSSSSSSTSSADASPRSSAAMQQPQGKPNPKSLRPPGYIWEILVMVVFEEQCQSSADAVARYSQGGMREFHLFMDVLLAASQRLHPADPSKPASASAEPIALHLYYTKEDCELFRPLWTAVEPAGRQCSPIIMHPADPSFNCTAHSVFTRWTELADFVGQLHQQLQAALDGTSEQAEEAAQHLACLMKQPAGRSITPR